MVVPDHWPEQSAGEHPTCRASLTLVTGRVPDQYNAGTMTCRTPLSTLAPHGWLELAPEDADALGIPDGALARVVNKVTAVRMEPVL